MTHAQSGCRRTRYFSGSGLDAVVALNGGPAWLTDHVSEPRLLVLVFAFEKAVGRAA